MKTKATTNRTLVRTNLLKLGLLASAFAAATAAQAITFILNPANGHFYGLTDGYYRGIDKGGRIGQQPTVLDAEALAVSLGGHLVTINDAGEQAWILANFGVVDPRNSANLVENFWIGLNDLEVEGDFLWFSGEPVTYLNWASTEPADDRGEDVVMLDHPSVGPLGKWNDLGSEMLGQPSTVYRAIMEITPPQLLIAPDGSGGYLIGVQRTPDVTYRLQRAPDLSGPWDTLDAQKTVADSGFIEFHDTSPLPGQAFYRTVQP